ncbi:MAG: hypothetical protein ACK4TG_06520, partial [Thermaurantiacus sp.]
MADAGLSEEARTSGPPRPRFVFTLGVTGHRQERIPEADWEEIRNRVCGAVEAIQAIVQALAREGAEFFAAAPPDLRVLSALSDGADSLVAEAAINRGFALDCILPFAPECYVEDFCDAEEQDSFRKLFAAAENRLILPGQRDREAAAYALAGEAIVAQSTLLVAVWDGRPGKGWGGTADVVETAVESGVPVLQISPNPNIVPRLLWPLYEPMVAPPRYAVVTPSRPFTPENLADLLRRLLLPPDSPLERQTLAAYQAEKEQHGRGRLEYPLLLHLAGVQKLKPTRRQPGGQLAETAAFWAPMRADIRAIAPRSDQGIGAVEEAFAWADGLATHYAQTFRSAHVLNFTLAAFAVVAALLGLAIPQAKLGLVILELVMIGLIIWNTRMGVKRAWQRRWLDYRALAERLHPIPFLKLLGVASPPRAPSRKRRLGTRWVDWYVAAAWRSFATPSVTLDEETFDKVRALTIRHHLDPQIAYHRRNAQRMHKLEQRLHRLGQTLFVLTIASCVSVLLLLLLDPHVVKENAAWFVLPIAGFPALGGAAYALRVHGDYEGSASRSMETAAELQAMREALEAPTTRLTRAAGLLEDA